MAKVHLIAVALLFSVSAQAQVPISFDFRAVTVPEVVEGVIKGVLKRDYVLSSEVLGNGSKITMQIRQVHPDNVLPVLQDVLAQANIAIEDRGGVLYVNPSRRNLQAELPADAVQPQQSSSQVVAHPSPPPPREVAYHRVRGKSLEFLSSVAKLAGAHVSEGKDVDKRQKGDVLVYAGTAETLDRVRRILNEIDSPAVSLNVKAALVEYREGGSSSRSFNLALNALKGKLGLLYDVGSGAGNVATFANGTLQVALSAIDGDSRFRYVAEPSLRVMDGETARFVVGSDVPVRGQAIIDKNGNPAQSIEYRTAGVVVAVEPKVVQDRYHVQIRQTVSTVATTTTSGIDSPTILKREAETTVSAEEGELIIIAGMDETNSGSTANGLAWLPRFLWSSDTTDIRSQLLLMLEIRKVPQSI